MVTRRTLIRGAAGALAGAMVTRPVEGAVVDFQELPTASDERLKMLTTTAVDAAMAAGAKYVDARLTFTQEMRINAGAFDRYKTGGVTGRIERMYFGVRAQYDGYWGFASSPVWMDAEAVRLGRSAVADAKANVLEKSRELEMAPNPAATSGDWKMPVIDDPFETDPEEIYDYLSGLQDFIFNLPYREKRLGLNVTVNSSGNFFRQQRAFGSSDGQFVTQRLYRTGGVFAFNEVESLQEQEKAAAGALDQITMAGAGFEYLRSARIREWIRELYEELAEERRLPIVPVDVGRYLSLIPSTGVARLLKGSVGVATEIDRVMGYEANAGGTSYIVDPDEMLGSLKIGASAMNVTGTRSLAGGLTHVRWDDEGVEPKDFALVQDGILTNLQTNREGATWMKHYSQRIGQPIRSHGCAYGFDAREAQVVHPADMILHPDPSHDTTLSQLREQMEKGIEFKTPNLVSMDFQQSTGLMTASAFEIKNGKRVARVAGPGLLFRTSELWGNLQALGGASSVLQVGTSHLKGEPLQVGYSSVAAPPALFKEMSVINPMQKA